MNWVWQNDWAAPFPLTHISNSESPGIAPREHLGSLPIPIVQTYINWINVSVGWVTPEIGSEGTRDVRGDNGGSEL